MSARAQPADTSRYADFFEGDFPFITTTVVADSLSGFTPPYNWTVRGLVVQLGADTYFCFDPDLLRAAVVWEGASVSMTTMAQVSYHRLDKGNANPRVLGDPIAANGMYPGWMTNAVFDDPRESGDDPNDPGRGPLPVEMGRFEGVYVHGRDVVLSYRAFGTHIDEQPGLLREGAVKVVTRTITADASDVPLTLAVADVADADVVETSPGEIILVHGDGLATAVMAKGVSGLAIRRNRYVTLELPAADAARRFRVAVWTGPEEALPVVRGLNARPIAAADDVRDGGPPRWSGAITTGTERAPDSSAFVYDHIQLPDPNPWRRNVRPADLAFFSDGRAAVVTFEGDVWIVDGLQDASHTWRRFASGLYEPLAIEIVGDEIYAYGREGIIRLHDLNGDGEADYYEYFSPGIIQSSLSREWPFDLIARPGGGFFASQGGALDAGATAGHAPFMPGFLRGSPHNGTVLEVSADGRDVTRFATGFRGPYLGMHPETGTLTASDQQGNFVPSTPIYAVERGGYYGVPSTAHRTDPLPRARPPIVWTPHRVDPSATSQVWMTGRGNGPLDGHMVHLSYGRSGLFRVYVDSLANPIQGAVAPLPDDRRSPTLKGTVHPLDGRLYVTGFQVWGSTAEKVASLRRLRYTGRASVLPTDVRAGEQGIVLTFDHPIERPDAEDLRVRRWNYLRSAEYGSGHYRLDGSEGEEVLPVAGLHLSADARTLLVVVPDMRVVMQMAVEYDLSRDRSRDGGEAFSGSVYLTVNDVRRLELAGHGLEEVDWQADLQRAQTAEAVPAEPRAPVSAERGRHLYHEVGCVACHSIDGTRAGNLGPTFNGLYGSARTLASGETVQADADYIRTSILDPAEEAVAGYDQEMPSFRGILAGGDVESIILFIQSLNDDTDE